MYPGGSRTSVDGLDGKVAVEMGYAAKESLIKGSFIKLQ